MSIAVINIKDLIKYALILCIITIIVISGIIIVKAGEEVKKTETVSEESKASSFLHYLEAGIPLMSNELPKEEVKTENSTYKILDTQLAMLNSIEDDKISENIIEEGIEIEDGANTEQILEEETENRKIEIAQNVHTRVISENNIEASFTDNANNIQVKNQSKYDITDLLNNPSYELKNKEKVIIYHTHTCESYTPSERYGYAMTGAYRTTDLNYTVSKVRRWTRRMLKTIWKNSNTW